MTMTFHAKDLKEVAAVFLERANKAEESRKQYGHRSVTYNKLTAEMSTWRNAAYFIERVQLPDTRDPLEKLLEPIVDEVLKNLEPTLDKALDQFVDQVVEKL